MNELIITIWLITSIVLGIDAGKIKKSFGQGFLYFIASLMLWIIVVPLWVFYERGKELKKENKKEEKDNFQCSECDTEVEENTKFCPNCGAKFEEENECTKCHHINKENAKFCSECGNELKN